MASNSQSSNTCVLCQNRDYDLICSCGDRFDFDCIHQHVAEIETEIQDTTATVSTKLDYVDQFSVQEGDSFDIAQTLLDNWKRKRLEDINDIADKLNSEINERRKTHANVFVCKEEFNKLCSQLSRPTHECLDAFISLQNRIQNIIDGFQNSRSIIEDEADLDALLHARLSLSPSTLDDRNSTTVDHRVEYVFPNYTTPRNSSSTPPLLPNQEPISFDGDEEPVCAKYFDKRELASHSLSMEHPTMYPSLKPISTMNGSEEHELFPQNEYELTSSSNSMAIPGAAIGFESLSSLAESPLKPAVPSDVSHKPNDDLLEPGTTQRIKITNAIEIFANNDKYVGAICLHNNELLFNDFDISSQNNVLVLVPNLSELRTKILLRWNNSDSALEPMDNDWIQDIAYSNTLHSYLVLNRVRLRLLKDGHSTLDEFCIFPEWTMKRLSCNDTMICLAGNPKTRLNSGDEIILMDYSNKESVIKTLRDIVPNRINRGSGPFQAEITDLCVASEERIALGYRFERRREVGIILFRVVNNGKDWAFIKNFTFDNCWHSDLTYSPRMDWCENLKVIIITEHLTSHMIMIDQDGHVRGECSFLCVSRPSESPINLSVSTNKKLAVRYESSITIHDIN